MNKINSYYVVGIILFSFFLGSLVALSKSPLLGVIITSLFGLAGSLIGVFVLKKDGSLGAINFRLIGITLSLFSCFFLAGIIITLLIKRSAASSPPRIIWDSRNRPQTVNEALDWILVEQNLRDRGYSTDDIKSIYGLRKEKLIRMANGKEMVVDSDYLQTAPYYKIFIGIPAPIDSLIEVLEVRQRKDDFMELFPEQTTPK